MAPPLDTSYHAVRRRLAAALSDPVAPLAPRPLEVLSPGVHEAPSIREADVIEGRSLRAHEVKRAPASRFAAFLDGSQLTLVAGWHGTVPVVHGTVSATVRIRVARRLRTWRQPVVQHALYAPIILLPELVVRAIGDAGIAVVDTTARRDPDNVHPFTLQELGYQAVLRDRESAELTLAAQWVAAEQGMLFMDGGIAGDERVANAPHVIGVVKSHHTVYAAGDALGVITALRQSQRSSVVRVEHRGRTPVASW